MRDPRVTELAIGLPAEDAQGAAGSTPVRDTFLEAWAADTIDDLRSERDSLKRQLADALDQLTEHAEALHDLCMDQCEREAIGGGPNWRERHAKTWARAFEVAGMDDGGEP